MRYFSYFWLLMLSLFDTQLCYSQLLTTDRDKIMYQLPRTADDFQSKFYDPDLESVYPYNLLDIYDFDGLPILEHKGKITEMSLQIFQTVERFGERELQDTDNFLNMYFDSTGELTDVRRNVVYLYASVPSSTKVGSGIKLGFTSGFGGRTITIDYTRDEQNRVVEAEVLDSDDPYLIFKYSYLSNSNKISTIKGYDSNGNLIGEVFYSYNNRKLIQLHYKGYEMSWNKRILQHEYKKQYSYDNHGNYSQINYIWWNRLASDLKQIKYTFENQYNSQGLLTSSKVGVYHSGYPRNKWQYLTRRITYDDMGNWTKIDLGNGKVVIRKLVY